MSGVAALFNYFMFSNLAKAILMVTGTLFKVKTPHFALAVVPYIALLTAVYFQFRSSQSQANRPLFTKLTPGEIMVGFKQRSEGKEWAPALKGSKVWWLLLGIINFFIIGNYWDFLSNGYIYNWTEALLRLLLLFLFSGSMITVGNGRSTAFLGILIVIGLDYGLTPFLFSQTATTFNGFFNLTEITRLKSGLWGAINSLGLLYYLYHQNPDYYLNLVKTFLRGNRRSS